jgi:hypothetical protein
MSDLHVRDVSEAVVISMTEAEMANWCRKDGTHVVYQHGCYWKETRIGFYQPVHLMARLHIEQAKRPVKLCWGFQAALCEDDAKANNGSMPVHLLSDVAGYDLQSLSSNRRHNVRRYRKRAKIVQVISPELLQEQGYEVVLSALKRTANPYEKTPSKAEYLAGLADWSAPHNQFVLAGLIDDKLGGYITGYAVGGTAYTVRLYIATEALSTYIGTGLIFEFVQACRRASKIHEVCYGLHLPEDPALGVFKESMGFPLTHIPTKISMNPIIGKFIAWYRPYIYYRLTGHQ